MLEDRDKWRDRDTYIMLEDRDKWRDRDNQDYVRRQRSLDNVKIRDK